MKTASLRNTAPFAAALAALILLLSSQSLFAQAEPAAVPVAVPAPEIEPEAEPEIGGPKIYVLTLFDVTDEEQSAIFFADAGRIRGIFHNAYGVSVFWDRDIYESHFDGPTGDAPVPNEWSGALDGSEEETAPSLFDAPDEQELRKAEIRRIRRRLGAEDPDFSIFDKAAALLRSRRVKPDDALFIFWSGHGAIENGRHYLRQANGKSIPRQELLDAAKGCGARLTVLITDSCASLRLSGKSDYVTDRIPCAAAPIAVEPLFEELFFNYRGTLDVNSSSEGERAYSFFQPSATARVNDFEFKTQDVSGGCFSLGLASEAAVWYPFHGELINAVKAHNRRYVDKYAKEIDEDFLSFGAFDVFVDERRSWRDVLNYAQTVANIVFRRLPYYNRLNQRGQHIKIFEEPTRITENPKYLFSKDIPTRFLGGPVDCYDKLPWTPQAIYMPLPGDVVLEINGIPVNDSELTPMDYEAGYSGDINAAKKGRVYTMIRESSETAVLKLKDVKSGRNYYYRTKLLSFENESRIGITPAIDAEGNLTVGSVVPGSPATRGQFAWE